jgi:hypothetical protein
MQPPEGTLRRLARGSDGASRADGHAPFRRPSLPTSSPPGPELTPQACVRGSPRAPMLQRTGVTRAVGTCRSCKHTVRTCTRTQWTRPRGDQSLIGGRGCRRRLGLERRCTASTRSNDVSTTRSQNEAEILDFFGTITSNLLAAEQRGGIRHHVLLSTVGADKGQLAPHIAGKREQERLGTRGPFPGVWSVPPSSSTLPAARGHVGMVGPETPDLVDMAHRTFAARGERECFLPRRVPDMTRHATCPWPVRSCCRPIAARFGRVTLDGWLAESAT